MDECVGSVQNEKMVALVLKAREEKSAVSLPECVYVHLCVCVYVCHHPGALSQGRILSEVKKFIAGCWGCNTSLPDKHTNMHTHTRDYVV